MQQIRKYNQTRCESVPGGGIVGRDCILLLADSWTSNKNIFTFPVFSQHIKKQSNLHIANADILVSIQDLFKYCFKNGLAKERFWKECGQLDFMFMC